MILNVKRLELCWSKRYINNLFIIIINFNDRVLIETFLPDTCCRGGGGFGGRFPEVSSMLGISFIEVFWSADMIIPAVSEKT